MADMKVSEGVKFTNPRIGPTYSTHNHPTHFWDTAIFADQGYVATAHGENEMDSKFTAALIVAALAKANPGT